MSNTMLYSSTREIKNTTNFSPIKSVSVKHGTEILSLANMAPAYNINRLYFVMPDNIAQFSDFTTAQASFFCLSKDSATYMQCRYLNNVTITDFDYDSIENMVYFCGVMNTTLTSQGYYQNIVGKVPLDSLFSSTPNISVDIFTIELNTSAYLQKIDFYRTPSTLTKKLSLIANDKDSQSNTIGTNNYMLGFFPAYYISFNIDSITYRTFSTYNTRLTDVIHTQGFVIVCGMKSLQNLVLYSHVQNDPIAYTCKSYSTPIIYHNYKDPQYEIAPLIHNLMNLLLVRQ